MSISITIEPELSLSKSTYDAIVKHVKPTVVLNVDMYDTNLIAYAMESDDTKADFDKEAVREINILLNNFVDFVELAQPYDA